MLPGLTIPMAGLAEPVVEVLIPAGGTMIDLATLFTAGDKAGSVKKRAILPSGVTRGSNNPAQSAIYVGTGWGGQLELVINGDCDGAGGAANSGVGGTALKVDQAGLVTLKGTGRLRGGGGGGGKAGNGGPGSYTATEGPFASDNYQWWEYTTNSAGLMPYNGITWAGEWVAVNMGYPHTTGGYTYWRTEPPFRTDGFYAPNEYHYNVRTAWPIYRTFTAASSGGIAGNGGRGQGYDGAATAGAGAVAGGTNAGSSGKSGDGGAFGAAGQAGANGTAGNNGGGSAGSSGGLAGYAIQGYANVIDQFSGTKLGRT